jgi:hypothetical protein
MTFIAVEILNGCHLSVRAVASLVTGEAGTRVESRLELSNRARISDTSCFSDKSGNGRSVVDLELSRLRLDELNSRNERFDRVSASSTQVTLGKGQQYLPAAQGVQVVWPTAKVP